MICNIATEPLRRNLIPLQIALGILLWGRKWYIKHLYSYEITCSHDEMRRFRKSSAIAAYLKTHGSEDESNNISHFHQFVIDNFDCNVTHALAIITIGPPGVSDKNYDECILWIKKADMAKPVRQIMNDEYDNTLIEYTGMYWYTLCSLSVSYHIFCKHCSAYSFCLNVSFYLK